MHVRYRLPVPLGEGSLRSDRDERLNHLPA